MLAYFSSPMAPPHGHGELSGFWVQRGASTKISELDGRGSSGGHKGVTCGNWHWVRWADLSLLNVAIAVVQPPLHLPVLQVLFFVSSFLHSTYIDHGNELQNPFPRHNGSS